MRKVILSALVLAFGFLAAGCERNDYQHPMYRSTKNKEPQIRRLPAALNLSPPQRINFTILLTLNADLLRFAAL